MLILGIETSCDETSAAVVRDGRDVLSNAVYSQISRHSPYGGVVPEIASRCHVEVLPTVIKDALHQADVCWEDLDAVAATRGPGLASSLLIGYTSAKALALRLGKPLIDINHLEAHLYGMFLGSDAPNPADVMPMVALLVSGGHTCLIRMDNPNDYQLLGQTLDDAAGEALDKGASLLGLGYPGGPVIEQTAKTGDPSFIRFPKGLVSSRSKNSDDRSLCFSYSGVKTSLRYYVQDHPEVLNSADFPSVVASYQEAIFDALAERFEDALRRENVRFAGCGGGVVCNQHLCAKLHAVADRNNVKLLIAKPCYCTDNAAMVAGLAARKTRSESHDPFSLDIRPSFPVGA